MKLKFRKERMIRRVKYEGRESMIDEKTLEIMDNLDGCEAMNAAYERIINDRPVMWVIGKDGKGYYVHEYDCSYE